MIGLMIIGSAAGSPMLPKWVKLAKGDLVSGVAIMVLLMGTSIIYLPLVLPRLISGVNVEAWGVAQPLILMIVVPFIVGLLLNARYPGVAAKLEPLLDRFSQRLSDRGHRRRSGAVSGVPGQCCRRRCHRRLHAIPGAVDGHGLSPWRPGCGHPTRACPGIRQRNIEAVLLVASTSVADPKVLVIAVIAALVIFIMLLGTALVFGHRAGLAGHKAIPDNPGQLLRGACG